MLVLGMVFTIGVSATGCKKSGTNTPPKGDGAKTDNTQTDNSKKGKDTVKYTVEVDKLTLDPNAEGEIKVSRSGKTLKAEDLKVEVPEASKLTASGGKFAADGKSASITLKAAKDSPPGEHKVMISLGEFKATVPVMITKKGTETGGTKKTTTYKVADTEVMIKQGGKATISVSREGGDLKEQAVEVKVEGNDKVSVEGVTKFGADEKTVTVNLKAAKDAPTDKDATVKIHIGEYKATVTVKVGKEKAQLNVRPARDVALAPSQVDVVPAQRASFRREVALFTRE